MYCKDIGLRGIKTKKSFSLEILIILSALSFIMLITGNDSALIYTSFFFISVFVSTGINHYNVYISRFCTFLLLTVISVFVGLRNFGVGIDTTVYIDYYFHEGNALTLRKLFSFEGDKGFLILAYLSSLFSEESQSFLLVIEIFICTFTFAGIYVLNKKKKNVDWSIFIFIWLLTTLNSSMNLMRQYCAMAVLFLAFCLLLKGRWVKAISLQLLSYFFHSSSIIFLPVFISYYLLIIRKTNKKGKIFSIALLIGGGLIFIFFMYSFFIILADFSFISEELAERYGRDSMYDSANIFGIGFILLALLIYIAIYISRKKKLINENEAYFTFCIHTFVIILRLSAFFVNHLVRMSTYYMYIDILLISIMISSQLPNWLRYCIYACFCYLWYRENVVAASGDTYPYKSFILGI